jgi:corrinoid protein of di/trimethylamine methyltransferase
MAEKKFLDALREDVLTFQLEGIKKTASEAMNAGIDPVRAIIDGLAAGLEIIGERFGNGDCFLSELILAAEVMKDGMSIIQPYIKGDEMRAKGKIVLATVEGDNHDIGKSLVATLLKISGFDVIDLGVDVSKEVILEAVKMYRPDILGLSALLTVTMLEMQKVIHGLVDAGLRDGVKVIVGGSPVTEEFAKRIGADHNARNAMEGVNKCIEWISRRT